MRERVDALREWLERLLLWRVWERMLEIEFVDRSVALAGKAFVSFFPLVIVVAALVPEGVRESILTTLTHRLGLTGDALTTFQEAFASADDVRRATSVLGLFFTFFFAASFTTAMQRVYLRAWRRPRGARTGAHWRGAIWLVAALGTMAALGFVRGALDGAVGVGIFAVLSLSVTTGLWWFTPWLLLLGDVRPRVLLPGAVITSVSLGVFALSATIWMPGVVEENEIQFGFFGTALSLITWFSGMATCLLVGACAGPVFAEDPGRVGSLVRGQTDATLTAGAPPSLPPPAHDLTIRDAFQSTDGEA